MQTAKIKGFIELTEKENGKSRLLNIKHIVCVREPDMVVIDFREVTREIRMQQSYSEIIDLIKDASD